MEHIINQLVEIDSAGQAMVREAQELREAERAKMDEYKRKMYDDYMEKQQNRVEQYRQFQEQELHTQLNELQKTHTNRLTQLRQVYDQNAQQWVDGMVQRCIGG